MSLDKMAADRELAEQLQTSLRWRRSTSWPVPSLPAWAQVALYWAASRPAWRISQRAACSRRLATACAREV